MRVQVSARSGTRTPNSREPKRVRVAGSLCRKPLISWSIDSPLAHPAGVSEPPWTLPGKSSTPVRRQPMPRMWASPSPRTLSQTPRRISVLALSGSRGLRLSLRVNLSPSSSGQNAPGTTPLGLNITTIRCFRRAWLASPRLGKLRTNGSAAAPMPRSRRKSRRLLGVGDTWRSWQGSRFGGQGRLGLAGGEGGGGHHLDRELAHIVITRGEGGTQFLQFTRAIGADRLLHQVVEELLDEGGMHLLAVGKILRQVARAGER